MERLFPCTNLEKPSLLDIWKGMTLVFATGVGIGSLVVICGWWCLSHLLKTPWHVSGMTGILIALLLTDFAYYLIHRLLNHSDGINRLTRWFRKIHGPHHATKELDFFRGNLSTLFDTAVTGFQVPLALIAAALGMNLESMLTAYALVLLLQSTHHANHTFNIGTLRYIFVDNHCHKLHHCRRGFNVNFAAIFSVWDLIFFTYYEEWDCSSSYMVKHAIPLPVFNARAQVLAQRR